MVWSEKPCNQCCWNGGFKFQDAMRAEHIEFVVTNHQWIENDSLFGDLILPITTCVEENDVVGSNQNSGAKFQGKCAPACDRVGESMSDYEIGVALGERFGVAEKLSLGMTDEEWFKYAYDTNVLQTECSWEQLCEKGYYLYDLADGWDQEELPGMRGFYLDPEKHALDTPSGKLEFYSAALEEHFPGDKERGGIARWVSGGSPEEGWTHDECIGGPRSEKYPLLLLANPSRWRLHVQGDDVPWVREFETMKVKGKDGYLYEPCWIHPNDAAARGIVDGDIVKVLNDRGIILTGARVSERVIPGCVMVNKGSRVDPIATHIDRGGSANLLSPAEGISKHCWGFAVSGYLVEAEKLEDAEMEAWKQEYPDAFAREYDPATGVNFSSWVIEE
ncbi:MAG: molybdopterin-dependent oxidoreductase [Eggerthellaceae bacterium]|nr:molybdopterin-dependent oxidoreductase [Eggerthellaceae bacterium]